MHMKVIGINVQENTCASRKITCPTPQTPFFINAEYQLGIENITIIREYVQSCQL